MQHAIEIAKNTAFLLIVSIGMLGLLYVALSMLDRLFTRFAKHIGLWPYLTAAIWKYCKDQKDREDEGEKANV